MLNSGKPIILSSKELKRQPIWKLTRKTKRSYRKGFPDKMKPLGRDDEGPSSDSDCDPSEAY